MLILSLLSLIVAERVKIASKRDPAYVLTILQRAKGDFVRLMRESDIYNPAELSGFDISGDTTELNNNGISVCDNGRDTRIMTCIRSNGEKTVFNVIRTAKDVTFKTKDDNCLTMGNPDPLTNGFQLKLYNCRKDDGKQKFILVSMNNNNELKTPPPIFPNGFNNNNNPTTSSTNEINSNVTRATQPNNFNNNPTTPSTNETNGNVMSGTLPNVVNFNTKPATLPNGVNLNTMPTLSTNVFTNNSQNNANGSSSNIYMPNILFVLVSLDQNYSSESAGGTQLTSNSSPFCFSTNQSTTPTFFNGISNVRKPVQSENECNYNFQWTNAFRRLY